MSQARPTPLSDQDLGRRELHRQNKLLQQKLDEMVDSVNRYRATQSRFESFELNLLECQNLYDVIQCLTKELPGHFKLDAVSLTLLDPEGITRELLLGKVSDFPNLKLIDTYPNLTAPIRDLQAKRLIPGGAIGHIRTLLSAEEEVINVAGFRTIGIKSVALLPLIRDHLLIGYICLGSNSEARFTPGLATDLLSNLAAIIAVCLENSLGREQLRQLSQIDMLTRVKNRRAYDQALRKEITRSQRQNTSLSCLFADLDHFKSINDSHGHATGDRVLKAVANAIQDMLRESDTLARIGGEEFTVLLPATGQQGSHDIAERIRQRIEQLEVVSEREEIVRLTTSIGYACWTPGMVPNESVEDIHRRLMGNADKAVYRAKQNGRNMVCSAKYKQLKPSSHE